MPTQPTHTWSQIKTHLKQMDKQELILLLRDLHSLNGANKLYLAARFEAATPDEIAAPFRAQIEAALNPDPRNFRLDISDARKALNSYKRFTSDPLLLVKMMLHLLDQGLSCVANSSGVADRTLIALGHIYGDAAGLSNKIDNPAVIDELRPHFEDLLHRSQEADWGLFEAMMDDYMNVFPQEDVEESGELLIPWAKPAASL